ncbi:MAG: hypothetical protein PVI90_09250 [Desulfobacteraceae bacterium]|jgi:hypothetical protein
MARVRPNGAERWQERASGAGEAYKTGIQNPRRDWAEATAAAKDNWKTGVQQAAQNDRFVKGVQKAGSEKQKQRAVQVGADRFAQGVTLGVNAYREGIQPYLDVINNLTLPPRYTKGDPRNIERVKSIAAALRAKKLSM